MSADQPGQLALQIIQIFHRELGELLDTIVPLRVLNFDFILGLGHLPYILLHRLPNVPFAGDYLLRVGNQLQVFSNYLLEIFGGQADAELAPGQFVEGDFGLEVEEADQGFRDFEDFRGFFGKQVLLDVELEEVVFQRKQG